MKSIVERAAATAALSVALAVTALPSVSFAQSSDASAPMSRSAARKANHQLERQVVSALSKAKIDVADVRVIAKHGEVDLAGEVAHQKEVDDAATVAGQVPGVTDVKNYLTVYEGGGR
ncbi:BON domain-containing protein [Paraburkholderia sp. B3]|uniref:BON domain-containing protein n=1 Tax=Paraburkholderia sp. B3 TaxID=3134791 RepID=UPI003982356D